MRIVTEVYKPVSNKQLRGMGLKPQLGYVFMKGDKYAHDHRCPICGKWFAYNDDEIPKMIQQKRWNFTKMRPLHCNSALCQEYEHQSQYWARKRSEENQMKAEQAFNRLKKAGLIA